MRKDWKKYTFDSLCKTYSGKIQTGPFGSQLHESDYVLIGTPVVMPKDIIEDKISTEKIAKISLEMANKLSKHKVRLGDILLPRRGDINKRAFIKKDQVGFICGTGCIKISFDDFSQISTQYLNYYLARKDIVEWLDLNAVGATMKNISGEILKKLPILLPPLATQQKIASILSAYDDLIENNLRRIKLLEEMAAITYKEWFVNFTIDGQKLEIDAETGLPFGWENGCIGNLISFQNGFAFKSEKFTSSGYPVIKIKNIGNRSINIENSDFIDEAYAQSVDKFKLHEGDLLIAMTGATIGKVGYLPKSKKSCFLNQRVGRFQQIDDDFNNKHFAFCAIDSEKGQQQIINLSGGAAQPNISSSQILSMECLIPQREILKKFHELVDVNIRLVLQLYTQNRLLKEARDILLPRLMSGEIELT
jgi:type I restriction enzyme S subunit